MATSQGPSASTGGQAGSFRDRDPPPGYDGEQPELTFRQFQRQVRLWEHETDLPLAKRGVKLLRQLTGAAALAVEDLEIDLIIGERGVKNVMAQLEAYFLPHLEVSLPRAFETAVYGEPRAAKESYAAYVKRMERAFNHLSKEGVDLPDGAKGYILYRQASLTEAQDQRLLTWAEGKYTLKEITMALRRLDKVVKEKSAKSNYFEDHGEELELETYEMEELYGGQADDDEYVYVAEGDLNQVMEEDDVQAALASYKEIRQNLKDQRLGRGYFPGVGKGKGFAGKGKGKGKTKTHIEQLKLRTKCRRCQQIGHWERECTAPKPADGANRSFFIQNPEANDSFWLRQFVAQRRAQCGKGHQHPPVLAVRSSEEAYKERSLDSMQFCGITTRPHEGVVDTAAEGGLIGTEPLATLQEELARHGLKIKWTPKVSTARGVGGDAKVEGVALIPIGIGGINGTLETTVVQGNVPLLLPIRLLRALGAVVDLEKLCMHIRKHHVIVSLREMASGHITTNIVSFAPGPFEVPVEAGEPSEFLMPSCYAVAMPAQHRFTQFDSLKTAQANLYHGGAADEGKATGWRAPYHRPGADGCGSTCGASASGASKLADDHGQSDHSPHSGGAPVRHRGLVLGASLAAAIAFAGSRDHGRLLQPGYPASQPIGTIEVQSGAQVCNQRMCAPQGGLEGWGKRQQFVHCVQGLPCSLGVGSEGCGCPEAAQARPLEPSKEEPGGHRGCNHLDLSELYGTYDSGEANTKSRQGARSQLDPSPTNASYEFFPGDARAAGRMERHHDEADGLPQPADVPRDAEPPGGSNVATHREEPGTVRQPQRGSPAGDELGSGERTSAGEAHADADPLSGGEVQRADSGGYSGSSGFNGGSITAAVQMREDRREAEGEGSRQPTQGQRVLEVRATPMRLLRVGAHAEERGGNPHRDGLSEVQTLQKPIENSGNSQSTEREEPQADRGQLEPSSTDAGNGSDGISGANCRPVLGLEASHWTMCGGAKAKGWVVDSMTGKNRDFIVDETFMMWDEDQQQWHTAKGAQAFETARGQVKIQLALTDRGRQRDLWEEAKETQFTRKNRTTVRKALEALHTQLNPQPHVGEVYSPPRVSAAAEQKGMTAGTCYDLLTGWDLSRASHRKAMCRQLREEKPKVLMICPPCTAFSPIQELNYYKMRMADGMMLLCAGLEHLYLAAAVMRWQLARGGHIIYEHPNLARSWQEECIKKIEQRPSVRKVTCDMCCFGMNVDGRGLNKKPTSWLTDIPELWSILAVRCNKSHFHQPLTNGRPAKAQVYPPKLCRALAEGIRKALTREGVALNNDYMAVEHEGGPNDKDQRTPEVLHEEEDEEHDDGLLDGELRGEQDGEYSPTGPEKNAILKVHKAVGHPQRGEFVRFLRAARVRKELVRWAAREFKCEICEAKAQPKAARPAAIPRSYQPNRVVGVDLFYITAPGGGSQDVPVLNMLDWGTHYQMAEILESKQPEEVWEAFSRTWMRTFGPPEVLTFDAGREFLKRFMSQASGHGIVTHQIAAKAPWQQGKTERHGGHFKALLEKARSEFVVRNLKDLRQLVGEVEQAKNRYANRSGFAPVQRQIGQWPRLPTTILSDEGLDPSLVAGVMVDDVEKLHEMRRIAQKAFCEYNAKEALTKALKARPRTWQTYKPGEYIFVYRVPRFRKTKNGSTPDDIAKNKPTWVGPGTVIAEDGANLWVSMLGELWKVAREQCRPATTGKKTGIEAVLTECQDLIDEFKRNPHRAGYKDFSQEEWPPEEEDPTSTAPPTTRSVRFEEGEPDTLEYTPSVADEDLEAAAPVARRRSIGEPEQEEIPTSSEDSTSTTSESTLAPPPPLPPMPPTPQWVNPFPQVPETPPVANGNTGSQVNGANDNIEESWRQSIEAAQRLDGLPANPRGPVRHEWRRQPAQNAPYFTEGYWYLVTDEEDLLEESFEDYQEGCQEKKLREMLQPQSGKKDYWQVDHKHGKLRRIHQRKRKTKFNPTFASDLPIPVSMLSYHRETVVKDKGTETWQQDDWRESSKCTDSSHWWVGFTQFDIADLEGATNYLAEKKGQDTVDLRKESPEDLEEWMLSDLAEWNKVASSGAVQVLPLEQSRRVRQEPRAAGKEDRILPTKFARRYKPAEQPGEPAVKKSRICLRGDKDPDILELERFSPTLNTVNFNILLQLAANEGMRATVGDLKNAFCQSQPLQRPNGPLYFQQPKEGIKGLHRHQIVLIINGVYGLVDGPIHWRQSLLADLDKLGYKMSAMDPCIMRLFDHSGKKLLGAIAIEVDDLFTVGHEEHHQKMAELRKRYTFGKYVYLQQEPMGCAFNGRRIMQKGDGEFQIDMEKFILERLHPVQLKKGRNSQKKELADEEEKSQARAACGALNWLSKEGRPDAAGPSSLMASKLSRLTIEDIQALNTVVKGLKENASLKIRVQPLQHMKLSIVTDASFANNGYHSQGGQILLAHERQLRDGLPAKANVLAWRSGRLQRVVNSTLAAETQSLSKGLADLTWAIVLTEELRNGRFNIKEWRSKVLPGDDGPECIEHHLGLERGPGRGGRKVPFRPSLERDGRRLG